MFRLGYWKFDWTAFRSRGSCARRYLSLFVLLTGSCQPLDAEPTVPEFFGVYLKQGERLSRLEPRKADSHELNDIKPVEADDGDVEFLVYIGGATNLMDMPVIRLERVAQEIDARTGAPKPLKNVWYIRPSQMVAHVAPVQERPGLLVRGKPSGEIPTGYWAVEVRENYYPFAVGKHAVQAAGCLQRGRLGGYEPCRPAAPPPVVKTTPARSPAAKAMIAAWGFGRGLSRDIWGTAVARSTAGLGLLLIAYAFFYWLRLVLTRSYFLEVAPFRVWGDAAPKYMAEGLAACVVDELQRLQEDIREHGKFRGSKRSDLEFHKTNVIPPATAQVTIEFKGMSPEALHAFLRRSLGRYALITCDLVPSGKSLRLLGRSASATPWKVKTDNVYDALPHALREFAVHAVVAVRPSSRKALANALAHKQAEAFKSKDNEEALRLAELAMVAMPNQAVQLFNRGVAYSRLENHQEEAIKDYSAAIDRDDKLASAFINRAVAYAALGKLQEAETDLETAQGLEKDNKEISPILDQVKAAKVAQIQDEEDS